MNRRHIPQDLRDAAVADYRTSKQSYKVVAARHGVSAAALNAWVREVSAKPRGPRVWTEEEVALTGGRWVNDRGVMRWQPFLTPSKANMSDRERRVEWEDAMFDEDEARTLHARHANGCREARTVVGERVYQRRKKRAQTAKRVAA